MQPASFTLIVSKGVTDLNTPSLHSKFSTTEAVARYTRALPPPHPGTRDPQITRTTNRSDQNHRGKNKRPGTRVCKSDGSTNLRGRLRLGHGHWGSHAPRVGEAPRETTPGHKDLARPIDRESLEVDRKVSGAAARVSARREGEKLWGLREEKEKRESFFEARVRGYLKPAVELGFSLVG
jgi:hypothetical protein